MRLSVKEILKRQNKKIDAETMELAARLLTDEFGKKIDTLNQEITNLSRIIDSNGQCLDECERALEPEKFYNNPGKKSEAARESIRNLKKYYETKVMDSRMQCEPLLCERKTLFDKAMLENPGFAFRAHALVATRWAEYAHENAEAPEVIRDKVLRNMRESAAEAEKVYMRAIKTSPEQREVITKSQTNMRIAIGKVR